MALPMDHMQCLKEYKDRIDLAWMHIFKKRLHTRPLGYSDLADVASKYDIKVLIVLDMHRQLQENLLCGMAMDMLQGSHDETAERFRSLHPLMKDRVREEIEILRRKSRG